VYSLDLYLSNNQAPLTFALARSLDRSFSHRLCCVSLPHVSAVLACVAAASYVFLKAAQVEQAKRGEDVSSPFLPSPVLESSSFALKNKPAPATQARVVLIFRL